jgi:ABC-2 type transport system ATP-binding protein
VNGVIVTAGLSMTFGGLQAVDELALDVPEGVVFGFLGPNGAGKTTTIRLLLGLLEPTSGRALVAGLDTRTDGDGVRSRCGVLLDDPGLYDRLTAEENLDFYARVWRLPRNERAGRIRELLEHIALWDRRTETVADWSLGMRKKLAIARALLHRPTVLFLDEPTTGLDPIARSALRDDITTLAEKEGTTVFLTTHDLDDAQRMCGLVTVMKQGRVVATGSPDDLRRRFLSSRVDIRGVGLDGPVVDAIRQQPGVAGIESGAGLVKVTLEPGRSVAPLVRLAVERGVEVEEVAPEAVSLEDAFLAIVGDEPGARATPQSGEDT